MKLGIDMHNVRDGGGVSYTANLLAAFNPQRHGFDEIHVFGADAVLALLPDRPCVIKHSHPLLARPLLHRLRFLFFHLTEQLRAHGCDMLYSPGGLYFGGFRPFATISRNMMPFEKQRWSMYPLFSFDRLRLVLLRWLNTATFRRADGMVFLTNVAKLVVGTAMAGGRGAAAVIAHGVNHALFNRQDRPSLPGAVPAEAPIRLVYPSRMEPYKHQVEVIKAVAQLRLRFPQLSLSLCGPANAAYHRKVAAARLLVDPDGTFVHDLGELAVTKLPDLYQNAHLLVFASSCENLPNTLVEAMAFGIPVVSANCPPMPDVASDACLYFDPTRVNSISSAIEQALLDWPATLRRVDIGLARAAHHSWARCADQTFAFLRQCSATAAQRAAPL